MDTKLSFPQTSAPDDLQVWVQEEGKGEKISDTDFVLANYVGQVWGNSQPFDSSFKNKVPTGFPLQGVIAGWTQGLSGLKVGTKVILSIPPELGYGENGGNAQAGIKEDDVIAFYVELVDAFGMDEGGQADAEQKADVSTLPVSLEGEIGKAVTIKVKEGQAEPTKTTSTVIATGSGEPVGGPGSTVYMQYALSYWDNSSTETTYGTYGPQAVTIGQGSALDVLEGVPVGSRVVILIPATDGENESQRMPAYAAVVDILAQTPAQ